MRPHVLSRDEARRIAVRAQLLDASRPVDLHTVAAHLTFLQDDRTAAVVASADLVAWSRLGAACRRDDVAEAVADQSLIDLRGLLRPAEDIALYRADMAEWPGVGSVPSWLAGQAVWVKANDHLRRDILDELRRDGPLSQAELPSDCDVPWRSTGWNNNRNQAMMLDLLVLRGEVAVTGRRGRGRLFDLAERVYPDDEPVPSVEATSIRNARRLRAMGIARARGPVSPGEPNGVGEAGDPAVINDVKGGWRVDPAYLGGDFAGRTALLSPLDRLIFDRDRMADIFEFDYLLEMYKPAATRRWGYWAMPVLRGDRLVGKVDATSDRDRGVLRVDAIHRDGQWPRQVARELDDELDNLAGWLGLVRL